MSVEEGHDSTVRKECDTGPRRRAVRAALKFGWSGPTDALVSDATILELDPERTRGAAVDGLGGGVETTRQYLSEDFPGGSQRTVERWLKTLIGRNDVQRIWFKPMGSKSVIWEHRGPLTALPDLSHLFERDHEPEIELAAAA